MKAATGLVAVFAVLAIQPFSVGVGAAPAAAKPVALETYGQIRPVKGTDFWTLTYIKVEGGRGKKVSAFVQIKEKVPLYTDRLIRIQDLKKGDKVWVLGKPVERVAPSLGGLTGMDRQMTNVAAMAAGEALTVNKAYKDRRDAEIRWLEAEITQEAPAVYVGYKDNAFKLVMRRGASILRRAKKELKSGEKSPLKSGLYVGLYLDKNKERPETNRSSDAKKESYVAKAVVIPDPRLVRTVYPMLFK